MNDYEMFIAEITNATGITYDRIQNLYKESELTEVAEIRELFMNKFQLSFGYANMLAEIVLELEEK